MGFRKRNAKRSDNRSSAKVIMGKPASQLSKEEKKILSARMAEIRSENGGKNTVQNTIPFLCMYQDGVCQVSENFFSLTVQFFDANYSISEFEEQNNIFSKYCDVINLFDNTIKFQLTFENQNRSKAKLVKTVQIPEQDDDFNAIRKEYSEMLTDKLLKGSNGQSARKFLTFGIESTSYKAARAKLMSIKNDVSFLIDGRLSLYEHQSTYNPNLPLRFLLYIANQYASITKDVNLYGTRLVEIPTPEFIIFYNGRKDCPDRQVLRLSDMYTVKDKSYKLELEATMLNINGTHNQNLKEACRTLKEYAIYTDKIRKYAEEMSLEDAVERAICECIKEGVLKEFLEKHRAEAKAMSIFEYDQEKYMRQTYEETRGCV